MYEKILVPLDGSELAQLALPYAEELAAAFGSEIRLLYVSDVARDAGRRMHRMYLEKMSDGVKRAAMKHGTKAEVSVSGVIQSGRPADEIIEYADREDIGLIIMATHGRSGISRWAMGSVADKVVRGTSRPVALIRAKGQQPQPGAKAIIERILVPLDGSKEGEAVLPYAREIASKLKASLSLLQTVDVGYSAMAAEGAEFLLYSEPQLASFKQYAGTYLRQVAAGLKEHGIDVTTVVRTGRAADEIVRYTEEQHTDLVAMSTHGRSGVGRFVFGSVAEKVLYEGNTPLFLVRVKLPGLSK